MKNLRNTILAVALAGTVGIPAIAQNDPQIYQNDPQNYQAPPSFSPQQLDSLVSKIALYPDPLLAQVLAAATFPDQIQDAAQWANQNQNLKGDQLANAIAQSNLPFDPAVQALLPFPSVLDTMAQDMNWTSDLGNAFLAQRSGVMDAVQRMRRTAEQYGYLQSNDQMRVVSDASGVEIYPYDPGLVYVPVYDPYVVYAAPRPGFYIGSAIRFGGGYRLGPSFGFWGGGFNWHNHAVVVNHSPWQRNWNNRRVVVDRTVNRFNTYNRTDNYRAPRQNASPAYTAPQNRSYERQVQPERQQSYRQPQQQQQQQQTYRQPERQQNYRQPQAQPQQQQQQQTFRQPERQARPERQQNFRQPQPQQQRQQQQQSVRQPERQSSRPAESSHAERGGARPGHERQ